MKDNVEKGCKFLFKMIYLKKKKYLFILLTDDQFHSNRLDDFAIERTAEEANNMISLLVGSFMYLLSKKRNLYYDPIKLKTNCDWNEFNYCIWIIQINIP